MQVYDARVTEQAARKMHKWLSSERLKKPLMVEPSCTTSCEFVRADQCGVFRKIPLITALSYRHAYRHPSLLPLHVSEASHHSINRINPRLLRCCAQRPSREPQKVQQTDGTQVRRLMDI